jgi:tRNA (mo5U34)-methyltransferase
MSAEELRAEVIRLGPWHIDIEITPEVSTSVFQEAPPGTYPEWEESVTFHNPHDGFLRRLGRAFPNGLEGRSVLDCACNCGAYLFYAKEAGAGRCIGFDVREHWIDQARFLAEQRRKPSGDMQFDVFDLYDLANRDVGRFDVTFFLGIFYHLPDPVTGLKLAADLTDELLILNTATKAGHPEGLLVADHESESKPMSGVHGLCWFPTGPLVLAHILNWLGFPEVRYSVWRHAPRQRDDLDRVELLAARTPGFFSDWDAAVPAEGRVGELLRTRTAPGATTLVMGGDEQLPEVAGRQLVELPTPGGAGLDEEHLIGDLERHHGNGARYVAVVDEALEALGAHPRLAGRLDQTSVLLVDEPGHRLYELPFKG